MKHPAVRRNIREVANAKLVRVHEKMVDEFVEQYKAYERSRGECLRLAVEIHQTKIWSRTHTTFADFLMDKLSIKKSHAYRLIEAAKIVEANPGENIANESQARAISDAKKNGRSEPPKSNNERESQSRNPTEQNSPSWGMRSSVKSESKPTKKDEEVQLDKVGTPIPNDALPYWNRQQEVQDILSQISKLKGKVIHARESEDPLWMVIDNFVGERFDQVHSVISQAKPFAVCTQCMGTPSLQPGGCSFCHSTGLISKWKWDNCSPKEIKEIRVKSNIDYAKSHNLNMPVPV